MDLFRAVGCCCLMTFPLFSGVVDTTPFSYGELESIALENNPELKVKFQRWRSAVAKVTVAKSLPDPVISYTEFLEEVQTRVGPQRRKVSLMQSFPWFGTTKLRGDVVLAEAKVLEQHIQAQKLTIVTGVRTTVYDLILLEKKIAIHREHHAILQALEASRKGAVSAGQTHLSNVLRVQVEVEALHDQIQSLVAMKAPLRQALEYWLGTDLDRPLPLEWPMSAELPEVEMLEKSFKAQSPVWLANKMSLEAGDAKLKLADQMGKPNLGLGLSWIDTGPSVMPNTPGSGDDPLALTLSMSLPLWRGKVQAERESAALMRDAAESHGEVLLQKFKRSLAQLQFDRSDAMRKIDLYRDQILPKAQDAYRSSQKGHESGRIAFQNVLDAERVLLRFTLDLETSKRDLAVAEARLQQLIGQL